MCACPCSNAAPWRGALDKWAITPLDASFPIQVDEDAHTVVVQGGVQTRVLLDYLANYMCAIPLFSTCVCRQAASLLPNAACSSEALGLTGTIAVGAQHNQEPAGVDAASVSVVH